MIGNIHVLVEHIRGEIDDISYIMLAAGRELASHSGNSVTAVVLGHNTQNLIQNLAADHVINVDNPALENFNSDRYLQVLDHIFQEHSPDLLILGHTTIGMDLASVLAARLELPLVSQCRELSIEGESIRFASLICGGKIIAEGLIPTYPGIVTLVPGGYNPEAGKSSIQPANIMSISPPSFKEARIKLTQYIEPDAGDVDISKESVLIAVGRGLQNQGDMELIEELADGLGGKICASRPIVDQGWLPTTRLVGKSGKTVKPKLYLALGISGAPEHAQAITESELIIAVNTDPNAPIFELAQYGIDLDMLDLLPLLSERVKGVRIGV